MIWILAVITTLSALSIGIVSDASAAKRFYDGNGLIPMMREYQKAERHDSSTNYQSVGSFTGYVTGVADALSEIIWCSDGTSGRQVTVGQFVAIVAKYLNDHPDQWNLPGYHLVGRALEASFPCRPSQ